MKKVIEKLIAPFTLATLLLIILELNRSINPQAIQIFGFVLGLVTIILIVLFVNMDNKDKKNKL